MEKFMNELSNCIRFLTVDAVMKANSGHVGMCLGLAEVMTVLFTEFLKHDPKRPDWHNRDRVVLSNGHGSMLLYSALYLSGYDWSIDELKAFRQMGSEACGHPELNVKKGIEVTTGPLGQGFANALGMAIAKERLNAIYPGEFDYTTYCFLGDGCLMEGISHEIGALAPKLVSKGFVVLWDDNGVSIDGQIDPWFERNVLKRFESYGFEIIENVDGHDVLKIREALSKAKKASKPCFIQLKTVIGKGCKEIEGHHKAHGQPLNPNMIENMRKDLKWEYGPFEIPEDLLAQWRSSTVESKAFEFKKEPDYKKILWDWCESVELESKASRQYSSMVLHEIYKHHPHLLGGSADLTSSNLTGIKDMGIMNDHAYDHPYIAYGVREFGMFAIANGLALSGLVPYVGTFLTFMDYGKNAVRMSALMGLRVIYILTHDSIGLGEDGPTHQPVEQLVTCRATPGLEVWRPCSLHETVVSWIAALSNNGPTVLALSRQAIDMVPKASFEEIEKGAYWLEKQDNPDIAILASGSEVPLALRVAKLLEGKASVDVISVPCMDRGNLESVIKVDRSRCFAIEAGSRYSWYKYAEHVFSVDEFGHSASANDVYEAFGLTEKTIFDKIVETIDEY